jgi:hypothetical protein
VERAEAHRRLEGREAGTFLVRVTPKEHEAFVLTILKKKGGTPHNLAIHKKEDGRFTVGHDESKVYSPPPSGALLITTGLTLRLVNRHTCP